MPALTPLPYVTIRAVSAFDMLDIMGVNTNIAYQTGGTDAADLPNRDGERELIAALHTLGIHHIRNQGLDQNPAENAGTAYPQAHRTCRISNPAPRNPWPQAGLPGGCRRSAALGRRERQ